MLTEAFSNIFIHYNWQFLEMLKDPKLSWDLAMMRMAKYAVKNIFGYLSSNEPSNLDDISKTFYQGNLLKVTVIWTVRGKRLEPIRRVFVYILFSITHLL